MGFQREMVVREYLKQFAKKVNLKNFEIHVYCDLHPREGIINFAEWINADMIAMATHGRQGLAHVMSGGNG